MIEMMPATFLSENNGFLMRTFPEIYSKVITPSAEISGLAMKARIEVINVLERVEETIRTKKQLVKGWGCENALVAGIIEDNEQRFKEALLTSPSIYIRGYGVAETCTQFSVIRTVSTRQEFFHTKKPI